MHEALCVTPEEAGQKLLAFIRRRLAAAPEAVTDAELHRWVRTGQVRVDGGRAKPFQRLAAGQAVRLPPRGHHLLGVGPSGGEAAMQDQQETTPGVEIVHQGEGLVAVNKPAGLPVQPGGPHADSVVTRLATRFAEAPFAPTPAHRLDRDTTGLVLAATTYAALEELNALFRERRVGKTYLAWVRGNWPYGETLAMQDTLGKRPGARGERVRPDPQGKVAMARATLLTRRGESCLVAVELFTGRTHQARVQLALRDHPIVGDRKYGDPKDREALKLHAWRLTLPRLSLCAPPPWEGEWAVDAGVCGGGSPGS